MSAITGWRVTSGTAEGPVLKLSEPVSFWGGIGPDGRIIDVNTRRSPVEGEDTSFLSALLRGAQGTQAGPMLQRKM